jgi:hypothetical protein
MWPDNGSVNPLHLHTICEEMSIYMKSVFLVVSNIYMFGKMLEALSTEI